MKKILITIIAMLLPLLASADAIEVDGIWYNLDAKARQAEVTSGSIYYSGEIVIPKTVTYENVVYNVTSIDNWAFGYGSSGPTSITIPNSVTSIGDYAFEGCGDITSITIPSSVKSIGNHAFQGCDGLTSVHISELKSWCGIAFSDELSNPLTHAHHLFLNGIEIKDMVIPSTVMSIGDKAFYGCSGLTSITMGTSVASIGNSAFYGCSGLTSITIGNNVTSIGGWAFDGCYGLTSITISNSVTSIGEWAFSGCSGMTSITIGNSVTNIGERAFYGCSGLASIVVRSENTKYDSRDNCNAIIETSSNTLVTGCKNTIIPNSVMSIGDAAFYDCYNLTDIIIPNSVTSIGNSAFFACSKLTSIIIPNSVTSIGSSAFSRCSRLTAITIPNSVTSIGSHAFFYCSSLSCIRQGW